MAITILVAALAVCGIFLVAWSITEAFLVSMPQTAVHVFYLSGDDALVEQHIRSCLWMKQRHGLPGQMLFVDCGISPQAQITAQLLLKDEDTVQLCAPSQAAEYIRWENDTFGAGAD